MLKGCVKLVATDSVPGPMCEKQFQGYYAIQSLLFVMYSLYLFCFVCDPKSRQPRKNKCETLQVNPRLGRAATTGQARNAMPHSSCHGEADSPPKTSKKKKWFGFVDALINFLLFNYKLYLNTKRTKQTTEPLEKNTQRKNTSTRRNSWSSASQNNSWHAELAVTEKQKVKHTKPSIKEKNR